MVRDDGMSHVLHYNWKNGSRKQPAELWTGRTVFKFKPNQVFNVTNAVKRGLLQRIRHALHLREVEKVLMVNRKPCQPLSKVDLLETFCRCGKHQLTGNQLGTEGIDACGLQHWLRPFQTEDQKTSSRHHSTSSTSSATTSHRLQTMDFVAGQCQLPALSSTT